MKKKKTPYERLKGALLVAVTICIVFICTLLLLGRSVPIENSDLSAEDVARHDQLFFLNDIAHIAVAQQKKHGILASITLAQAALESDWGKSQLAAKYKNLFGVKGNQKNGVLLPTSEYENGQWIQVDAYFRVYDSWEESIEEHSLLLVNGTAWNADQYKEVKEAKDYKEAARGLVAGSYATDPAYAEKLIALIELYQLNKYDK